MFQYDRGSSRNFPGRWVMVVIDTVRRWIIEKRLMPGRIQDLDLVGKTDQPGSYIDRRSISDQNAIKIEPGFVNASRYAYI